MAEVSVPSGTQHQPSMAFPSAATQTLSQRLSAALFDPPPAPRYPSAGLAEMQAALSPQPDPPAPRAGAGDDYLYLGGDDHAFPGLAPAQIPPYDGANPIVVQGEDPIALGDVAGAARFGPGAALVEDGSGRLAFLNGAGPATLTGGAGSATIYAGQGGGIFRGGADGENLIEGGSDPMTAYGGGGGDTLAAGGASGDVLVAASGNETLTSAASLGADTLYGGSGQDTLIAGIGGDLMAGGSGAMDFVFTNGFTNAASSYDIYNYHAGDVMTLRGYSEVPSITSAAGNTMLSLSDGTNVVFVGMADPSGLDITI